MQEPVSIIGDTPEDIKEYCQWIINCLDKEVLVESEIKLKDMKE